MIIEKTYGSHDLVYGICERCGEESSEIDPRTGMYIDCIEEERFYKITVKKNFMSLV